MKNQVVGAMMGLAFLSTGSAMATNVDPGVGSYTFQGNGIELTNTHFEPPIGITCNMELDVAVDFDSSGTVFIEVTDGRILPGGDIVCNQQDLQFHAGSWYASEQGITTPGIPDASLPSPRLGTVITGQLNNVELIGPLHYCGGSIVFSYSNGSTVGAPSTFSFTGAPLGTSVCTLDGVFEATIDVDVWQ